MIKSKEKNFISAVVYIRNNEHEIAGFFDRIYKELSENFEKYEIICVNDASTDSSVKQIEKAASSINGSIISTINMSFYQGLELSMNAGIDLAIGDFVFEFDSLIFDYPEEYIMRVYKHSLEGYDIVSAAPKHSVSLMSKMFYCCFNSFSKFPHKLRTDSFRIVSRRAINRVYAMNKTVPYRKAVYANCGLDIDTIIYENNKANNNAKNKKGTKQRNLAVDSLILFTDVAYKIAILFTFIMMCAAIVMSIYTIFVFFGTSKPVEGWTTTMLFLSFSFFGIFFVFSILIKYLSILVNMIFKKQEYLIESIRKLN